MKTKLVTTLVLALAGSWVIPTLPVRAQEVAARMGQTDVKLDEIEAFLKSLGEREQATIRADPAFLSRLPQ